MVSQKTSASDLAAERSSASIEQESKLFIKQNYVVDSASLRADEPAAHITDKLSVRVTVPAIDQATKQKTALQIYLTWRNEYLRDLPTGAFAKVESVAPALIAAIAAKF